MSTNNATKHCVFMVFSDRGSAGAGKQKKHDFGTFEFCPYDLIALSKSTQFLTEIK